MGAASWAAVHGDVLRRYALVRVRDSETAEDLVQETFLSALRNRTQFAGRSHERTWLVGILRHKIIDHYRLSGRVGAIESYDRCVTDGQAPFDCRKNSGGKAVPWAEVGHGRVEGQEFWAVFRGCMAKLPAPLAAAFCLNELEKVGGAEVCSILGITPSNLWTRVHRARLLLRRSLEKNWFGHARDSRNERRAG
ncbi:MAG: sigma-70 family RNA polymerase sigma factor [Phycisphaerae bacterium]|jgi:RNA polymerase sigma-70 factor (ECF subfamily)